MPYLQFACCGTTFQVVSADSEGFVKTWDLGTYQMIQSFMVDEITILRAFVSIPSSKRVIAVDREPPVMRFRS